MKKGKRQAFYLSCSVCKERNYITSKSVVNDPDKLELKKFCRRCRQHTLHKETKIPSSKK